MTTAVAIDDYAGARDYLVRHTDYERMARVRYHDRDFDLSRIQRLCELLGNPQDAVASVHLAGTKGKGSTAAMTAAMLAGAGQKVGLYTSPHLVDLRERIVTLSAGEDGRLRRETISEDAFTEAMRDVAPAAERMRDGGDPPSFFEIVTAMAFVHFAAAEVGVAVLEVGLGGRLDATNVVTPRAASISPIGIDHTLQLGRTLAEIAAEKAGIIKPGVPVVCAPQRPEAMAVIRRIAEERMAPLHVVGRDIRVSAVKQTGRPPRRWRVSIRMGDAELGPVAVPLLGRHQATNAAAAMALGRLVGQSVFRMDIDAGLRGLEQTEWPGRADLRGQRPWIVLDGAHTPDSLRTVLRSLPETLDYEKLVAVFGCLDDKDKPGLLGQLGYTARAAVLTRSDHPHSADPVELASLLGTLGPTTQRHIAADAAGAMDTALRLANPNDLVLVTGSLYLVGLVMKLNRERGWFSERPILPG